MVTHALPDGGRPAAFLALRLLADAGRVARQLGRDGWDFAVELHELRAAGVTATDLRWLLAAGLARHGSESPPKGVRRRVRPLTGLSIPPDACFVATEVGVSLASTLSGDGSVRTPGERVEVPAWDARLKELTWRGCLVKRFRRTAPTQEAILDGFESQGWPPRIDDPLGDGDDFDPAQRLHQAIRGLNRCQNEPLVRFWRDGTGRGVRWSAQPAQGPAGLSQPHRTLIDSCSTRHR